MEYIREELLRQQAALGRLLLGAPAPEEETAPGREAPSPAGTPAETAAWGAGERPETAPAARAAAASPRARTAPGGDVPGAEAPAWDGPGFGEAWGEAAGTPPTAGRGAGEARQPLPAASGWGWAPPAGRGPDWTGAPGEGAAVLVTEVARPAPREGGGARELSRVFQRDARRYDGGFRLY